MAQVDVDHSGTLDLPEFLALMSGRMGGWDAPGDLGACWRAVDPRGRGQLPLAALTHLLATHGARVGREELEHMFGPQTRYSPLH